MKTYTTIDEFIAEFPADVQSILEKLRAIIKEAAPDAQEAIRYGIPTFILHGNLVHFSAYKTHIGFYPAPSGIEQFKAELTAYESGKGTLRFPLDRPIPFDLIRRIVLFRVQENLEKAQAKGKKKNKRTTPDKAQIIAMLGDVFKRWEALLGRISAEQIAAPNRIGSMSIQDIVAHLTAWQIISVARMEAARSGGEPEFSGWPTQFDLESEEDVDQINAWIYGVYRDQPWPAIHQEWRERFLHFLELAQAAPEEDLLETGKYSWLKKYPLAAVLFGTLEHHQEHLDPLLLLFA